MRAVGWPVSCGECRELVAAAMGAMAKRLDMSARWAAAGRSRAAKLSAYSPALSLGHGRAFLDHLTRCTRSIAALETSWRQALTVRAHSSWQARAYERLLALRLSQIVAQSSRRSKAGGHRAPRAANAAMVRLRRLLVLLESCGLTDRSADGRGRPGSHQIPAAHPPPPPAHRCLAHIASPPPHPPPPLPRRSASFCC